MPPALRVLIVEDDPDAVRMVRDAVVALPRLRSAVTVASVPAASAHLDEHGCDLVVLELVLAGGDGLALLRRLRQRGDRVEVIVATQARDACTVRRSTHYGVVDYLVKPLSHRRLVQALERFLTRVDALAGDGDLDQAAIDRARRFGVDRDAGRLERFGHGS